MFKRTITWLYERYCQEEEPQGEKWSVPPYYQPAILKDVSGIDFPKPEHEWRRDDVKPDEFTSKDPVIQKRLDDYYRPKGKP